MCQLNCYENLMTIAQYFKPHIWCCHYLPPGSLHTLRASKSLSYKHISFELIWNFLPREILYRLIWMTFISMFSMYVQSGTHRHFNWWIITVLTWSPTMICMYITNAPKLQCIYVERWVLVVVSGLGTLGKLIPGSSYSNGKNKD